MADAERKLSNGKSRIDFQTDPSKYRHWKLELEGEVVIAAAGERAGFAGRQHPGRALADGRWRAQIGDGRRGFVVAHVSAAA